MARRACIALLIAAGCGTGTIDGGPFGGGGPDGGGGGGDDPPPVEVTIEGPAVLPHVQAFANAACGALGSCRPSTYEGHHPVAAQALDNLVSDVYGEVPSDDNALGDALAQWALDHQAEFGVMYVIWRQRYNDGDGWSMMEDRGSITQNHYDHVHVSFNESL